MISDQAIYQAADAAGKRLAENQLKTLRQECNKNVVQLLSQQKSALQQAFLKIETSVALIKSFAGLLLPPQQVIDICNLLNTIKYLQRSDFMERLSQGHVAESQQIGVDLQSIINKLALLADKLAAIIDKAAIVGDVELDLLQDKLAAYKRTVTERVEVAVPAEAEQDSAAAAPESGEVESLRELVVKQSYKMADMDEKLVAQSAQIQKLTEMVGMLVQQNAAILALKDDSTAIPLQAASVSLTPMRDRVKL